MAVCVCLLGCARVLGCLMSTSLHEDNACVMPPVCIGARCQRMAILIDTCVRVCLGVGKSRATVIAKSERTLARTHTHTYGSGPGPAHSSR